MKKLFSIISIFIFIAPSVSNGQQRTSTSVKVKLRLVQSISINIQEKLEHDKSVENEIKTDNNSRRDILVEYRDHDQYFLNEKRKRSENDDSFVQIFDGFNNQLNKLNDGEQIALKDIRDSEKLQFILPDNTLVAKNYQHSSITIVY